MAVCGLLQIGGVTYEGGVVMVMQSIRLYVTKLIARFVNSVLYTANMGV